jgi:hypothetical protein
MSGPDAMHGEMPGFFPGRPGGEHEPLLDMIFDRRPLPPGAPPEMHDLARMLAAVAGPAEPGDLAGEATALAEFARLASPVGISPAASRPARHRLSKRPRRPRLAIAAALITAAAGLAGITAAYVGVLPRPIQHFAHVALAAPLPPYDESQRPPAVTGLQPSVIHSHRTPAPRTSRPAIPAKVHGSVNRSQPRHRVPAGNPWPVAPTCTPQAQRAQNLVTPTPTQKPVTPSPTSKLVTPTPTQKPVTPSPTPSSLPSASTPPSPPPIGCLNTANQNAVSGQSR